MLLHVGRLLQKVGDVRARCFAVNSVAGGPVSSNTHGELAQRTSCRLGPIRNLQAWLKCARGFGTWGLGCSSMSVWHVAGHNSQECAPSEQPLAALPAASDVPHSHSRNNSSNSRCPKP